MRRHRSATDTPLRKGPNGRNLCRWCGIETTSKRRTFCSEACVHEWLIRSSASYARDQVLKRDHGVCAACGLDTVALMRQARQEAERLRKMDWESVEIEGRTLWLNRHLWEADHIVPVAEGGGDCGLENLRTLCRWCHARETGLLRRRLHRRQAPQEMLAL